MLCLFFFVPMAFSQETAEQDTSGHAFHVEGCDFTLNFPAAPVKSTRCKNPKTNNWQQQALNECYDVYSYTQIFTNDKNGRETQLKVDAFCRPSTDIMYSYYDKKMLTGAVRALVSDRSVVSPTIGYNNDNPAVKTISLTNEKSPYSKNNLITAQIWVSKNAVFSADLTLTGEDSQDAKIEFTNILNSIKQKPEKSDKPKSE